MSDEREGEKKRQLLELLQYLATVDDPEIAHSAADATLLVYINDEEIREAFEQVPRWYA